MSEAFFLNGARLPDFGSGAGYAIFALRVCACGASECCTLRRTFNGAFGAEGEAIREDFDAFARILGWSGRRPVTLAPPGTSRITADEVSFIAAAAAAQSGQADTLAAHLTWLFAGGYPPEAEHALTRAAAALYLNGVWVRAPDMDTPITLAEPSSRIVACSGHA